MYFYHLTIITKDFDKSYQFYTQFVGLNVNREENVPGRHRLAFLADHADDTQIEIVHYDSPFTAETKGITICFACDDVEAMREKALAFGLEPSEIRSPHAGLKYFYVYDPDRVSIEFKQEEK
ncbi:MAG: VOC family protein [Ruminococcaceae bacterium]|nr:VOC family protein [Oscillospiraceae bacterium]